MKYGIIFGIFAAAAASGAEPAKVVAGEGTVYIRGAGARGECPLEVMESANRRAEAEARRHAEDQCRSDVRRASLFGLLTSCARVGGAEGAKSYYVRAGARFACLR